MRLNPLETARAAWGSDMPDWIEALAIACTKSSQAKVAARLDRTGSLISQVLNRKYPAGLDLIEERVRGVLLNGQVQCPSLGPLLVHECREWRVKARNFQVGNPLRIRMFRACSTCPRNQKEIEE